MLFAIFSTYTNGQELPETRFDAISRVIDDVVERDLFYNIINQQDYQSDYVILFRAVGERTPFADVFARTLDEYKTSKEKIDYSCSFMEAFLVIDLHVVGIGNLFDTYDYFHFMILLTSECSQR